ncbi:hypothetical protein J6590_049658 [Homalodisca vitripennis]|nr:hypothetical protein J6590_049658 [Homalodisca vitripennis]
MSQRPPKVSVVGVEACRERRPAMYINLQHNIKTPREHLLASLQDTNGVDELGRTLTEVHWIVWGNTGHISVYIVTSRNGTLYAIYRYQSHPPRSLIQCSLTKQKCDEESVSSQYKGWISTSSCCLSVGGQLELLCGSKSRQSNLLCVPVYKSGWFTVLPYKEKKDGVS